MCLTRPANAVRDPNDRSLGIFALHRPGAGIQLGPPRRVRSKQHRERQEALLTVDDVRLIRLVVQVEDDCTEHVRRPVILAASVDALLA